MLKPAGKPIPLVGRKDNKITRVCLKVVGNLLHWVPTRTKRFFNDHSCCLYHLLSRVLRNELPLGEEISDMREFRPVDIVSIPRNVEKRNIGFASQPHSKGVSEGTLVAETKIGWMQDLVKKG